MVSIILRGGVTALIGVLAACTSADPTANPGAGSQASDVGGGSSNGSGSSTGDGMGDDGSGELITTDADDETEGERDAALDTEDDDAAADAAATHDASPDEAAPEDITADALDAGLSGDERFGVVPRFETGVQTVIEPFVGVRIVSRMTSDPRPLQYHVVQIDPRAEGLHFRLTPQNGDEPRETTRQTTQAWLIESDAQLAINGHFFTPWPPEDAWADVIGWAVSDGDAYSPFQSGWSVALALGADGEAAVVGPQPGDETGLMSTATFVVDDAVGARERILTAGEITATWSELHPRTAVGVDDDGNVVFVVVDGRQDGISEGMSTPEVAAVMATFDVVDAINLDGGGSTTLVVADPEPRLVNTPVGYVLPNSERDNGSNLAVFARPIPN